MSVLKFMFAAGMDNNLKKVKKFSNFLLPVPSCNYPTYRGFIKGYYSVASPQPGPVLRTGWRERLCRQNHLACMKQIHFTGSIFGQWWIAIATEIHSNWRYTSSRKCQATHHTTVSHQTYLPTPFPPWASWQLTPYYHVPTVCTQEWPEHLSTSLIWTKPDNNSHELTDEMHPAKEITHSVPFPACRLSYIKSSWQQEVQTVMLAFKNWKACTLSFITRKAAKNPQ